MNFLVLNFFKLHTYNSVIGSFQDALRDAKNERLWFKTMTKLGKLYFDRGEYGKLSRILKQLHNSCTTQVRSSFELYLSRTYICFKHL